MTDIMSKTDPLLTNYYSLYYFIQINFKLLIIKNYSFITDKNIYIKKIYTVKYIKKYT